MRKKYHKVLSLMLLVALCTSYLAMPTYASSAPEAHSQALTQTGEISPFWVNATYANTSITLSSGKASATASCTPMPGGTIKSTSLIIQEKAPGGSWKTVVTSASKSASCSTKTGYQYMSSVTFVVTLNGKNESIPASSTIKTA